MWPSEQSRDILLFTCPGLPGLETKERKAQEQRQEALNAGSVELPATALSSVCDLPAKTSNSEKTESQWGWRRSPGREGPVSRQVGLALESLLLTTSWALASF